MTGVFALDSFNGFLSLAKELNWEANKKYNFTVTAQDAGKPALSANATVTVVIFPANNNGPMFPEKTVYVTVYEVSEIS